MTAILWLSFVLVLLLVATVRAFRRVQADEGPAPEPLALRRIEHPKEGAALYAEIMNRHYQRRAS